MLSARNLVTFYYSDFEKIVYSLPLIFIRSFPISRTFKFPKTNWRHLIISSYATNLFLLNIYQRSKRTKIRINNSKLIFLQTYIFSHSQINLTRSFSFLWGEKNKKKNKKVTRRRNNKRNPRWKQSHRETIWTLNKRFQKEFRRENSSSNTGFPLSLLSNSSCELMDKNFVSIDKEGIAVIKRFPVNFHQANISKNGKTSNGLAIYVQTLIARKRRKEQFQHDFHRVSPPPLFIHHTHT